jgi:hypothetical protein
MRVCFLIGSTDIGGGTYVILQHALHLHEAGWSVTLVAMEPATLHDPPWHPALALLRSLTPAEVAGEEFDLAIATWWRTVYELLPGIQARRYAYFVQSIESWFYPNSDFATRNLANASYLLPMLGVTEALWIQAHLADRFGQQYLLAPNGCRKDWYCAEGAVLAPRRPGHLRVLVEGPLGVDFKNVARTIALVRAAGVKEVWLLTSSAIAWYPGVARVFSRVPASECGAIYRSCDVLVKLSTIEGMFGPPLEMFHCGGTAIVYDVTGHDEYIEHERNALVVRAGDEAGVIAALRRLMREEALLERLCRGALATAAAWPDWQAASDRFAAALEQIALSEPAERERLLVMVREFRAQDARVARGTRSGQRGPLQAMLRTAAAHSPWLAGQLRVLWAWLIEGRRGPAPRERI